MPSEVAVLGAGVAGLGAAHHLAERGFDVTVYEAADRPGGKARSVTVPGTGDPGLPGEHGFRFFPGFYRHVVDTMARIPAGDGTVADALVPTERTLIASLHGADHLASTGTPATPREWLDVLAPGRGAEVPRREAAFFAERLLEFLTTCPARRRAALDRESWWAFLDAGRMSPAYRDVVRSTRTLVALQPERASARTVGRIYVQLLRGMLDPALDAERVLSGPTSEAWIDPWVDHLDSLGVEVVTGARATGFHVEGGDVVGVSVRTRGAGGAASAERITADRYVAAVPVEVMADLLDDDLRRAAPALAGVDELETAWMNGIQFYLREDVPLVRGHQIYRDSPWALTAVSQAQFWDVDLGDRTAGEVEGVLSVIVSDWTTPGVVHGRPARECTPREIAEEVWAQVRAHLDDATAAGPLAGVDDPETAAGTLDEAVAGWFLDPAIVEADGRRGVENRSPLLVNTVGSLRHRPPADPGAGNLYLAADYVRTETDLATMEAADEAARRAVGAIVADAGVDVPAPDRWSLREPPVFAPFRARDRLRYRLGLPHPGDVSRTLQRGLRDEGLAGLAGALVGRRG